MIKLNANMFIDSWKIICFFVKNINRYLKTTDMNKKFKKFTTCQIFYFWQHKHNKFELVVMQSCISQLQKILIHITISNVLTIWRYLISKKWMCSICKRRKKWRIVNFSTTRLMLSTTIEMKNLIDVIEMRLKQIKIHNENRCRNMKKNEKKNSDDYFIMKNRI